MSNRERSKGDRGRSRSIKARDRAQMHFDDLLIDEYLNDEDALEVHEREVVKVRYGVRRLADHLSDSTIAYHVLGLGEDAPDSGESMELDVVGDSSQLFKTPHHGAQSETSLDESIDSVTEQFSISKLLSGMAYGTAAGLGLLLVLGMLF
ncbi:MAG: hypothetical protein DHS20C16_23430 [Phycisphaerae bacterium]|nr:MAG: hypothetical protein DHS20C16_23430 [Phycisphaerae bacterium]